MSRKKVFSVVVGLVIFAGVTACGNIKGTTEENLEIDRTLEVSEDTEIETEEEKAKGTNVLFERNIHRIIPEGYEYCKGHEYANWNNLGDTVKIDMPENIELDYSKIRSLVTNMYGISDYAGNILIKAEYSQLRYENTIDGVPVFFVEYENKSGYIDIDGNITVPFWDDTVVQKGVSRNGDFLLINEEIQQVEICNIKRGVINKFSFSDLGIDLNDSISISENGIIKIGEKYMLDLEGNVLREENTFSIEQSISNGHAIMVDYEADYDKYVINPRGEIVFGPYDYIINVESLYIADGIFYNSFNNKEHILDEHENLHPNLMLGIKVNKNGVAYVTYNETNGIEFNLNVWDFETNENKVIHKNCPNDVEIYGVYGRSVIYGYEGILKIIDFDGNAVSEVRYYGFEDVGNGALLKNEDGTWSRVNNEGKVIEESEEFFGVDEPVTYNGLPIICFRLFEDKACVVVEENGMQVGYLL